MDDRLTGEECRSNARILRMQAGRHQDHAVKAQILAAASEFEQLALNFDAMLKKREPRNDP
jgi:hypothetical protein